MNECINECVHVLAFIYSRRIQKLGTSKCMRQSSKVRYALWLFLYEFLFDLYRHVPISRALCVVSFLFLFCLLSFVSRFPVKGIMQAKGIQTFPKIDGLGCSPYASMVYGCVNAETFLHCPPEMWLDERLCNLAKQFAQQCNPLPHVPMPPAN